MNTIHDTRLFAIVERAHLGLRHRNVQWRLLALIPAIAIVGSTAAWIDRDSADAHGARVAHAASRDLWIAPTGPTHQEPCVCNGDMPTGTECASDGIAFVWIPPGSFIMGGRMSPEQLSTQYGGAPPDTFRGEYPMHKVNFSHGFWLGKYEMTNIEFSRFIDATGYRTDAERIGHAFGTRGYGLAWKSIDGLTWRNPGWDIEPDQPVVLISWNDATAFCEWLSETSGKRYRLPTDAEWEYACRAGSDSEYPWGDDLEGGYGWLNAADETGKWGQSFASCFPFSDGYIYVARVGRFFPNAWGLHDMNGNVWEWCEDWHASLPTGTVTDPEGPPNGTRRIIRGGSWHAVPAFCRASTRLADPPEHTHTSMGFRVARSP